MLINCVAYRDGKRVAEIHKEQISDYLKQAGTFVVPQIGSGVFVQFEAGDPDL